MDLSFQALDFGVVALAYALLSVLLWWRGRRTLHTGSLLVAMALTALWAGVRIGGAPLWLQTNATALRDTGWFFLLLVLLRSTVAPQIWRALAVLSAALLLLDLGFHLLQIDLATGIGLRFNAAATQMAVCAVGLILVENLLRNCSRDQLWALKLLGIGLGLVFAYHLFVEIPALFGNAAGGTLGLTEPLIYLSILPLLVVSAIRMPGTQLKIHSSRRVVFHSAALVGTGIVLESAALAAFYVRNFGGTVATVLALVLMFSACAALLVAASSAGLRSRFGRFINENFFNYKYDYRVEWGKFIASLSAREDDGVSLKVLRTLADLLDCPGGLLLVWREDWSRFMPGAQWAVDAAPAPLAVDDPLLAPFGDRAASFLETDGSHAAAVAWRARHGFAWLVVPLRYRDRLVGLAILSRPRASRRLDWEDRDLIALAAAQLAVHLVHDDTARALADARSLEAFNRRTAFIVHDMKNAIGQLALVAQNASRFGADPQFRQDMILSLRQSVARLQELLGRLKNESAPPAPPAPVDLSRWLAEFVAEKNALGLPVSLRDNAGPEATTRIDREALRNVLAHVIDNALEAAPGAAVEIGLDKAGNAYRISVRDKGRGMAPTFIADELFRPLRSTKSGFGLGAYQARQTMRELDGDLEVVSRIGDGTTVQLTLPDRDVAR